MYLIISCSFNCKWLHTSCMKSAKDRIIIHIVPQPAEGACVAVLYTHTYAWTCRRTTHARLNMCPRRWSVRDCKCASAQSPGFLLLFFLLHLPVFLSSSFVFTKSDVVSTSSSLTLVVTTSVWLWCQGAGRASSACWCRGKKEPRGHPAWSKEGFKMLFSAPGQGQPCCFGKHGSILGCVFYVCVRAKVCMCVCVREYKVRRARRLCYVMSCATEVRYSLERSQLVEFRGAIV